MAPPEEKCPLEKGLTLLQMTVLQLNSFKTHHPLKTIVTLCAPSATNPHDHTTLATTVSSCLQATIFYLFFSIFYVFSQINSFKNSNNNNSFVGWRCSSVVDCPQHMSCWGLAPASTIHSTNAIFLQATDTCLAMTVNAVPRLFHLSLLHHFICMLPKVKSDYTLCPPDFHIQLRWIQTFLY